MDAFTTSDELSQLLDDYVTADDLVSLLGDAFVLSGQVCPTGEFAVGFDEAGTIQCSSGEFGAESCTTCLAPVVSGQQAIDAKLQALSAEVQLIKASLAQLQGDIAAVPGESASSLSLLQEIRSRLGPYTLTCDDWNELGWLSRDVCLRDGRWHRVHDIKGPYTVSQVVAGAVYAFCDAISQPPGTDLLIDFDDGVAPWLRCYATWECASTWCYDGTGKLRLRLEDDQGFDIDLSPGTGSTSHASFYVRY